MKKILLGALALLSMNAFGQNVNIPDANFKAALLDHGVGIIAAGVSTVDTDGDGEISTAEAQAYSGTIFVSSQSISDLTGIEAFINLTGLYCASNQLTSIDVSVNTALNTLYCRYNQISSLDITTNTVLSTLNCSYNELTSLNVANGNNGNASGNLTWMQANNNPNLTCIQHDSGFNPAGSAYWVKDANASWSDNCSGSSCPSIVNIPDANFKAALLDHGVGITGFGIGVIDTDGDGEICQTEAQAYIGKIDVNNQNISDLTGIEEFTNITNLVCYQNSLTNLDVSSNTYLTILNANYNQLTNLDLSNNTSLSQLAVENNNLSSLNLGSISSLVAIYCSSNSLTSIDLSNNTGLTHVWVNNNQLTSVNLSQNTALQQFYCSINSITSLDITSNVNLVQLACQSNQLSSLDVSQNTALTEIVADHNQISSIDASNCSNLSIFYIHYNQLTSIDVSQNSSLVDFRCDNNQISSIDVSSNSGLNTLHCFNNTLTTLNAANGNNGDSNSHLNYMNATGNPNLLCIQHDTGFDPTMSGIWQKDATAQWSGNCSLSINEDNVSFSIVPNPTSGMVTINAELEISSVEIFSTSGQKVASFETKAFDLSTLDSGVYFVKVLSDNGSFSTRIIKE